VLLRPDTDRKPPAMSSARPGAASRHRKQAATESGHPVRKQAATESGQGVRGQGVRKQAATEPGQDVRGQGVRRQVVVGPQAPVRRQAAAGPEVPVRRQTAAESGLWHRLIRIAACVVVGSTLVAIACPVTAHWLARAPNLGWVAQADELGLQLAAPLGAAQQPEIVSAAVAPGYLNPLRGIPNLVLERIDQGVDFAGSGPVYALGDGVVTGATGDSGGWPGGGWITYQLSDGRDAGLMVYVAEDITPAVQVGEHVTSSTVVGNMFDGSDGIETGWAQPTGVTAESQAAAAGGIGAFGPFPTKVGFNFDQLLQSLGVPPAPNADDPASGLLPSNYPANGG
jgi:murein DD-endopeptidase MepM/ murein hydrolase activator NlpD